MPGVAWPAIPGPEGATAFALQFQLDRSQWLAPDELRELQYRQLAALLRHACATVPYYRSRWSGLYQPDEPLTPERFTRLPLLLRRDLQQNFDALKSSAIPPAHGPVTATRSSGSTGAPVQVLKTALGEIVWRAQMLRDHRWHRRDMTGKLAATRHGVLEAEAQGWGPATDSVLTMGRSATLPINTDVDSQLDWLERQQPDYLLTYPSNLAELAKRALARGLRLPRLREVRTMGELLGPEARELCRQAWGVRVTDAYSSEEIGCIALQCPDHEHYHIQSEGVLLEVLDDTAGSAGRAKWGG